MLAQPACFLLVIQVEDCCCGIHRENGVPSSDNVLVSVVTPAYNAAEFLENAVASVQAQTIGDWELIIVDDASTDETAVVAEKLASTDDRIRLLRLEKNSGPSIARNAGFAAARGEWIAVLDADDVYLPERLGEMMKAARSLDADILADNLWLKEPSHGRNVRSALPRSGSPRRLDIRTFFLKSLTASGFDYGALKPIFRAEFLRRADIQYQPDFRFGEDFLFVNELLVKGARGWVIPKPLYVYTLTTSELDGSRSNQSRTVVDYKPIYQSNNFFLERYHDELSDTEKAAIRTRLYNIKEYEFALEFKDHYRKRNYPEMFETLIRHPFIAVLVFRAIRWRLRALLPDQRPE